MHFDSTVCGLGRVPWNHPFPPQEDRDLDGCYEMFVFDPDGFRIEIAYGPPEETTA